MQSFLFNAEEEEEGFVKKRSADPSEQRQKPLRATHLRSKREAHSHPSHEPLFSEWKILVGPTDWHDHAAGKDGSERYRFYNLPTYFGPGVYELGLCRIPQSSHESKPQRRIRRENVVAVYVGQAENIRSRLQHYGRSGSHLEGGAAISSMVEFSSNEKLLFSSSKQANFASVQASNELSGYIYSKLKGCAQALHLFTEAFFRGYSVVFRWTAVASKIEAEKLEADLLRKFDYAWNRGNNGERRPHDVYTKLQIFADMVEARKLTRFSKWKWLLIGRKRVTLALTEKHQGDRSMRKTKSKVFSKFLLTRVCQDNFEDESKEEYCETGNVTEIMQFKHYGDSNKKEISTVENVKECCVLESLKVGLEEDAGPRFDVVRGVCGFLIEDGIICTKLPIKGRRRCMDHKGLRLHMTKGVESKCISKHPMLLNFVSNHTTKKVDRNSSSICGILLENGSICTSTSVPGRKRCMSHKGMRMKSYT